MTAFLPANRPLNTSTTLPGFINLPMAENLKTRHYYHYSTDFTALKSMHCNPACL